MASKTLANGKKVLVGSKADPDSKSYKPKATDSSKQSTMDTLTAVKNRATELIAARGTPPPTTEPSVISTESATDAVRNAQDTEKKMAGDPDKTRPKTEADSNSMDDITKFLSDEKVPLPGELSPEGQKARKEYDRIVANLASFKISNAELQNNINSIVQGWDARITQMEDINARREKTFETLGFRTGAQFSGGVRGGVFGGVIAEEERQGVMRIGELEALKQADIMKAKEAARTQNWNVYVQQVAAAEKKYQEQIDTITKLNKLYVEKQAEMEEEEKAMIKTERSITLDRSIDDLLKQGITDPATILDHLNYDDAGSLIGDVTLKEIKESIKMLSQDLTGASSTVKDFKLFFPNVDLSTPEGYQKYLRFKAQATTKAGKTTTINKPTDYDTWREQFMASPAGKTLIGEIQKQSGGLAGLEAQLETLYDTAISEFYEQNPPKTKYTATSIPSVIQDQIIADIESNLSLDQLYGLYDDVSSSYISSLYNSLKKKDTTDEIGENDVLNFIKGGQ